MLPSRQSRSAFRYISTVATTRPAPIPNSIPRLECALFMAGPAPYRDFTYPLNVFMHILTREEGSVSYLHYGLFESPEESLATAQEHSTELLLSRLPPPPARLLDAGIGLGTTLDRLTRLGYRAQGITPDAGQIAAASARFGGSLALGCVRFEAMEDEQYDAVIFQESAQYIESKALFAKARQLTGRVLVLDEFASRPLADAGALHDLPGFLAAASRVGFALCEEIDLSAKAAPTMEYFRERIPRYREELMGEMGVTNAQIEELVSGGKRYRERYADGTYVYRLLTFER